MGFDAIWISPIFKNLEVFMKYGQGYHGYWQTDFQLLNDHFGTEEDLKSLIDEAHKRDIYVMVDVVPNHVGYVHQNDFSAMNPFNKEEYYHPDCSIKDWEDTWQLENCRLFGLPDLKQENQFVRQYLL